MASSHRISKSVVLAMCTLAWLAIPIAASSNILDVDDGAGKRAPRLSDRAAAKEANPSELSHVPWYTEPACEKGKSQVTLKTFGDLLTKFACETLADDRLKESLASVSRDQTNDVRLKSDSRRLHPIQAKDANDDTSCGSKGLRCSDQYRAISRALADSASERASELAARNISLLDSVSRGSTLLSFRLPFGGRAEPLSQDHIKYRATPERIDVDSDGGDSGKDLGHNAAGDGRKKAKGIEGDLENDFGVNGPVGRASVKWSIKPERIAPKPFSDLAADQRVGGDPTPGNSWIFADESAEPWSVFSRLDPSPSFIVKAQSTKLSLAPASGSEKPGPQTVLRLEQSGGLYSMSFPLMVPTGTSGGAVDDIRQKLAVPLRMGRTPVDLYRLCDASFQCPVVGFSATFLETSDRSLVLTGERDGDEKKTKVVASGSSSGRSYGFGLYLDDSKKAYQSHGAIGGLDRCEVSLATPL